MKVLYVGCPTCDARIRASVRLIGKHRLCPRCGELLHIRPAPPADSESMIILDEGSGAVSASPMSTPQAVPVSA